MSSSISGNVVTATRTVILEQNQADTKYTVSDGTGDYTFSGLANGTYFLKTAAHPLVRKQIVIAGSNFTNVNFEA